MKIAIIGAGAMGCIYGGLLHLAGEEVWLVHHAQSHIEEIRRKGITLITGTEEKVIQTKAAVSPSEVGISDLIIIFTKSYDTAAGAREARDIAGPQSYFLTLQNGLGNTESILSATGIQRIIYGTTIVGGSLEGPGRIKVDAPPSQKAITYIGDWSKKRSPMLLKVYNTFNSAGIPTEIPEDIDQRIWTKVIMASGIGMTSALARLKVGDLTSLDEGKELLSMITEEAVEVAGKKGIKLDGPSIMRSIVQATGSGEHISSMLLAFRNQKRTEIGSLNGALAAEAERLGLAAPANQVVARLVSIIEKTYDRRVF